ncbi:uncharacterized protein G2W53_038435 [Senna tora]|uniref:Uncharacterized protein n=1 Tax=Senna tora TaxID=362788 RepID=A0A834SLQ2_9FABA|nr:uncharacterized protein G2W53_038435 [Senna tora]
MKTRMSLVVLTDLDLKFSLVLALTKILLFQFRVKTSKTQPPSQPSTTPLYYPHRPHPFFSFLPFSCISSLIRGYIVSVYASFLDSRHPQSAWTKALEYLGYCLAASVC